MYVTVQSGFCLSPGRDAVIGEVLEVDDRKAADLMYRRYVRESSAAEVVKHLAKRAKEAAAASKAAAAAEEEAKNVAEAEAKKPGTGAAGNGGDAGAGGK